MLMPNNENNNDFLAFEYASGLLNAQQKQAIKHTAEFEKNLKKWQLHLTKLNTQVPLDKTSALRIWQAINRQIVPKKPSIISAWLTSWRYAFSGLSVLGLLLSALLLSQTSNAQLQWDINTDFAKQQLSIAVTTHEHTNPKKVCTLWVKKDGKIQRIGLMPETGKKTLKITKNLRRMIIGGEMIISTETKQNPSLSPTIIEYQQKWKT